MTDRPDPAVLRRRAAAIEPEYPVMARMLRDRADGLERPPLAPFPTIRESASRVAQREDRP